MSLKIGDAGYRILGPIASGGMGDVYKAEHVITKRIEAIKLVSGGGTDEETDRFLREIQLQASLSHPNIAAVYNAFRVGDDLVMVMELVEGEALRALLERGRLPLPVALNYAGQVLQAMAYAHAHGVIHRDISPSNIVVTEQGTVKLMDFGLAKALASPSASRSGRAMGSPHYMSPEQVKDATQASARSDIYSLGAVFYEMATGRKVFEGDSSFLVMQAQVESAPVPPKQLEPAIPAAINDAILKALEKDPQRRFPTAAAFRAAIEQAMKKSVPPVAHPIVRTHPDTGRKAIFLGDHAESIKGMDYEEGRALIEELNVLTTPPANIYSHTWAPRQCIVWDNRCTLHRATGFDEARFKRVMRRCTIVGDRPF